MPYASLCINNPSVYVKLRICCRKRPIRKQIFPPVAPDGVCLDDVCPTHVYTIVTFTFTTPTGELRTRGSENRALSVQRVERFASEALKGGKIVTISSLKAFLMLHSIFVGLIATA